MFVVCGTITVLMRTLTDDRKRQRTEDRKSQMFVHMLTCEPHQTLSE